MKLYEAWQSMIAVSQQKNNQQFWDEYYSKEKNTYKQILAEKSNIVEGTVKELADKFNLPAVIFCGFIDGIHSSLNNTIQLSELTEESEVTLDIDFEKLYYNMLDARAKWLSSLEEWEDILSKEKREQILKQWRSENIAHSTKIGRNEPCPCGSGKKYKNCCQ